MAIDTWQKLINLPNAEYKAVIKAFPAEEYTCGSDWTSEGSSTYSHACVEQSVYAVTDDGTELTERSSVSEVQGNAGSWYFDLFAQTLYVRASDSDDLSNSSTTVLIMCFVIKQFATGVMDFDGLPCRPIVRQDSLPNMDLTVDDIVEGIYKFNFGSFSMNNDGWFDTASCQYDWFNKKILIYLGGEDLDDSEYILYFVGLVSDLEISDSDAVFSVKDIRADTFANIPIDHFWLADYPNLNPDDDGKPIPIWYGSKYGITPVCVDTYDSANLKAVADDGGSMTTESTEAHDTTENDMTLLPASPAVDDAYYFGHTANPFGKIHLLIGQQGSGTWEITWEYYNGTTWVDLSTKDKLDDGSDGFTAEVDEDEYVTISWRRPSNWATTSINSITAYWVRARVSSFTSLSVQPLGTRCKLDDTKGSVWKMAGHSVNSLTGVRIGKNWYGSGTDYTASLSTGELTLTNVYCDTTRHVLYVKGTGKVISTGSIGYSTKGADIARDILQEYLGFLSADLDLDSFDDTNSVRTQGIGIYLSTENSSREVLQTIGRSIIAFFTPTTDGKLAFVAYEPTTPEGTLELFDADYYPDWKVRFDHKFVRQKVIIYFDEHPTTQVFRKVEKTNSNVTSKYGIKEPLEIKTYLRGITDADNIAEGVRDMCSKPVTIAETSVGMKAFSLFPTHKVKMTRTRAADTSGSFSSKVFRIRSVSKDTMTERTHIIGMDDLQTLGAAFCYVCFSCQICVEEEAPCVDCYDCDTCFTTQAGCQVCDACQLCNTDQGGCQTCDSCEHCDTCQSSVGTCSTCQDCYDCDTCVTCESNVSYCSVCQVCYGCDTCDLCQIAVTCSSCDSCQNCNTCQVCNTTEGCAGCDICNTCQVGDVCSSCDGSCQDCVSCQHCYTTYNRCTGCQVCNSCQVSYTCGSCQTCQVCVNCDDCFTTQNCGGCDTCNTCQACNTCEGCESCDVCYTCELGN